MHNNMKFKLILLTAMLFAFNSICLAQSKTPTFKQYGVAAENLANVKVNLSSHREARRFRTNLRNAAKGKANFAGHFTITTWGCGTGCSQSAIIDQRDGRVFFPNEFAGVAQDFCEPLENTNPVDSPQMSDEEYAPIIYKTDSRLLVLNGLSGSNLKSEGKCGTHYLEWTGKQFKQVKFAPGKSIEK